MFYSMRKKNAMFQKSFLSCRVSVTVSCIKIVLSWFFSLLSSFLFSWAGTFSYCKPVMENSTRQSQSCKILPKFW